ncbi:hypothetical protein E2C01_032558 [Portunus trituberculatus]|uniref:Uncharacterized protein n=1 Tax=Portunus trituberculatus TaxID=210409 RepID=A0A5B7F1D0_PORTR|nr:hypothetical protein [Portunus trituberculatus]
MRPSTQWVNTTYACLLSCDHPAHPSHAVCVCVCLCVCDLFLVFV